jgi:hypothetical protein
MVKVIGAPTHGNPVAPIKVAVTVKVDVIVAPLVLVAMNAGTLPVPMVGNTPMSGVGTVRVQLKVTPVTLLVNIIEGTFDPAQTV